MNNLGPCFLANLPFIRDIRSLSDVLVQGDGSLFSVYPLGCLDFFDHKPFFQVSLSAIKMSLFLGTESIFLEFLSYLSPCRPFWKSLQHLNDPEVYRSRFAGPLAHVCHCETGCVKI